jgi:hypothetical protein
MVNRSSSTFPAHERDPQLLQSRQVDLLPRILRCWPVVSLFSLKEKEKQAEKALYALDFAR